MLATAKEKTEFRLDEATEYLRAALGKEKLSTRTFENYAIQYTKKNLPNISKAVRLWNRSDLDRYAAEQKEAMENQQGLIIPGIEKKGNAAVTQDDLGKFAYMLINSIQSEVKQLAPAKTGKAKKTIADFKDKLILTFNEAHSLSGLTKDELTNALEKGSILGKCTTKEITLKGRAVTSHHWKINRQSLEEFCKNYGKW